MFFAVEPEGAKGLEEEKKKRKNQRKEEERELKARLNREIPVFLTIKDPLFSLATCIDYERESDTIKEEDEEMKRANQEHLQRSI